MNIRKTRGVVALVAAAALLLSACGGGDSASSSGVVSVRGNEPQRALIPTDTNEVGGGNILDLLFAGLTVLTPEGQLEYEVAKSIESDDYTTWTVTLNEGWKFSDGSAVTSNSFVDAWMAGTYDLNSYFFSHILGFDEENETPLTGLEVISDTEFKVTLDGASPEFPMLLSYAAFYPQTAEAIADRETYGEKPVGNGPYLLEAWDHDIEARLVPNPDYSGARKAQNGGVTFKFYTDLDAAYNDLLANQLDVLDQIPDSAFGTYQAELGDRGVLQAAAIFQSFTINGGDPHFGFDEEGTLRRAALSQAINRAEITEAIFSNTRLPATDFTSPVVVGFDENIPGNEVASFDPAAAKAKWAEADEKFGAYDGTFTLAYNSDGGHQAWVDAIVNQLKNNLGINAEGKPYAQFSELRQDVTNRTITGGFRTGWQGDVPAMSNFLGPLYGTGAGSNDSDYANPEFDQLIREGQLLLADDADAAAKKFNEAQELLFRDLPVIPLWYQSVAGGWSKNVENVTFAWNSVPALYQITKDAS